MQFIYKEMRSNQREELKIIIVYIGIFDRLSSTHPIGEFFMVIEKQCNNIINVNFTKVIISF